MSPFGSDTDLWEAINDIRRIQADQGVVLARIETRFDERCEARAYRITVLETGAGNHGRKIESLESKFTYGSGAAATLFFLYAAFGKYLNTALAKLVGGG
jgi:hypothetical protein